VEREVVLTYHSSSIKVIGVKLLNFFIGDSLLRFEVVRNKMEAILVYKGLHFSYKRFNFKFGYYKNILLKI